MDSLFSASYVGTIFANADLVERRYVGSKSIDYHRRS